MRATLFLMLLCSAVALAAPDWAALKSVGDAALAKKDYPAATAGFRELVKAFPNKAEAHTALGFSLYLQGKFEESIQSFETALKLDPNDEAAQRNRILAGGRLALEQPYSLALTQLAELEKRFPKHPQLVAVSFYRGKLSFIAGLGSNGIEAWRKVAQSRPDSATNHFLSGLEAHRRNQLEDAIADYQRALAKMPDEELFKLYLASALSQAGRNGEAQTQLSSLVNEVTRPELKLFCARLLLQIGQPQAARDLLQKALSSGNPEAFLQMAALDHPGGSSETLFRQAFAGTQMPALFVFGDPGAAWLDSLPVGGLPLARFLPPGAYRFKIQHPDGRTQSREFRLAKDKMVVIKVGQGLELREIERHPGLIPK